MSLVLNMVGGGSGGGISPNDALLVIYTPLGSSVTATNGTATKTSSTGIALSDRPMVEIHLLSISSSQFGTWTVTATRGTDTNSTTISVTAVEQYELYIGYHVPIGEYQEVEYLEGTGTQRITTSLKANLCDSFTVKFKLSQAYNSGSYGIFGARASGPIFFDILDYNSGIYVSIATTGIECGSSDTNIHVAKAGKQFGDKIIFDDVENGTISSYSFPNANLALFALYNNSTLSNISKSRIYYAITYKDGNSVWEFYPCYRLSDSVAGMYEKNTGVFYTNSGSGTFTVGADV